jgi:hypothetical protein
LALLRRPPSALGAGSAYTPRSGTLPALKAFLLQLEALTIFMNVYASPKQRAGFMRYEKEAAYEAIIAELKKLRRTDSATKEDLLKQAEAAVQCGWQVILKKQQPPRNMRKFSTPAAAMSFLLDQDLYRPDLPSPARGAKGVLMVAEHNLSKGSE